jgi:hypothetical protein
MRVIVADTTTAGQELARLFLDDMPDRVALRDLITHRVREEVARFNATPATCFSGLVQPAGSELTPGGYELAQPRTLDWQVQAEAALTAFRRNGFFVFVADRQVDDLDEELTLAETDVVSFVRLVPLVGG